MMDAYTILKLVHILGASILFGTGIGIAFFMFRANLTGDPATIASTASNVVLADYLFTLSAVILQPITGALLVYQAGYQFNESWIQLSLGLYVLIGFCWLPVVYLQTKLRNYAQLAAASNTDLSLEYYKAMRLWFWLGWPAFTGVFVIFWLMIRKPVLW